MLGIYGDFDSGLPKLCNHAVQVGDAEIDHPLLVWIAEMIGVLRKRGKCRRPRFLGPGLLVVIRRHEIDTEIFQVPKAERSRIVCSEKQPSDSGDAMLWHVKGISSRFTDE